MSQTMNKLQLLENALASYQAAARELIAELKQQRDDVLAENEMLRRDIAKLDNFLANQDEYFNLARIPSAVLAQPSGRLLSLGLGDSD